MQNEGLHRFPDIHIATHPSRQITSKRLEQYHPPIPSLIGAPYPPVIAFKFSLETFFKFFIVLVSF